MRRRSALRFRKAIRVARLFCEPRALQLREIDKRLGFPQGTASHLLKHARRLGLVTVHADLPMPLDAGLGSRLGRRFSPTRMLVIQTPHPSVGSARRGPREEDDLIHEALGLAASRYMAGRLRHLDLVGVGAGRAVFHAARGLVTLPGSHEKMRNVTVFGLHGRADRRVWRETSRYALQSIDAVRVTHALADALPLARSLPVHLPLVQRDARAVREALSGPAWFLRRSAWARRPPSLALVGLGVMGGPRALRAPHLHGGPAGRKPSATWPILGRLMKLRELCRRFHGEHGYIPVSDVCDRLFWVPEAGEAPDLRRLALPLIRDVNERLLTVETGLPPASRERSTAARLARAGCLDQVQEVVVVAGGLHKVRALHRLLRHWRPGAGRRFPDTLITDPETAKALLALG